VNDTLYEHPAYYDMIFSRRASDLAFYQELAEETRCEVLEIGAGTGRVSLSLARAGVPVVAVERSQPMVEAFGARLSQEPDDVRSRVEIHHDDIGDVDLGRSFGLIICPFNGVAHRHTLDELARFFDRVSGYLDPGGLFAFDVLIPDLTLLRGDTSYVPWLRDPERGDVLRAEQTTTYDARSQILTITTTLRSMDAPEGSTKVLTLELRQLFPQETLLLLEHHGFQLVQRRTDLGDVIGYVCRR
jgi:SAM-dependent methyltransferase